MLSREQIEEFGRIDEETDGDPSLRLFEYRKALKAALADREELIGLLRQVEWMEHRVGYRRCPICGGFWKDGGIGHRPDCRLVTALR